MIVAPHRSVPRPDGTVRGLHRKVFRGPGSPHDERMLRKLCYLAPAEATLLGGAGVVEALGFSPAVVGVVRHHQRWRDHLYRGVVERSLLATSSWGLMARQDPVLVRLEEGGAGGEEGVEEAGARASTAEETRGRRMSPAPGAVSFLPRAAKRADQIGPLDGAAHVLVRLAEKRADNVPLLVANVLKRIADNPHLVINVWSVEPAVLRVGCVAVQVVDIPETQIMLCSRVAERRQAHLQRGIAVERRRPGIRQERPPSMSPYRTAASCRSSPYPAMCPSPKAAAGR